jgi:hypothetical protein
VSTKRRAANPLREAQLVDPLKRVMPPELLEDCVDIIAPAENERQSCRDMIVYDFKQLVWVRANASAYFGSDVVGEVCRRGRQLARTLAQASMEIQAAPGLFDLLLEPELGTTVAALRDAEKEWIRLGRRTPRPVEAALRDAEKEWIRLGEHLALIASAAERQFRRTTRPADMFKRYCAVFAFEEIERFSTRRPTLSADGDFYLLASALYEAATGVRHENLERQCRKVWYRLDQ